MRIFQNPRTKGAKSLNSAENTVEITGETATIAALAAMRTVPPDYAEHPIFERLKGAKQHEQHPLLDYCTRLYRIIPLTIQGKKRQPQ
ncbi:unnamed protein product [Dibothriocephalus latus]|uniref:Uncharacterized protein n=1 Tax=Dibothriocephalus latus TaxID=60516 RepID=A0A3P7LZN7_DIBLA|nr:unnamed protein product [Dibothriocephalus latus]